MFLPPACFLLLLCAAPARAQGSEKKCFRADWLQGERVVNLSFRGASVSGTFKVVGDDGDARTYPFSGNAQGETLNVAFAGGVLPDVAPSEMTSLAWRLTKSGADRERLRIKFRGKNYQTNKYEESFADFEPCASVGGDYDALAGKAQRVRFARGASSASLSLAARAAFQSMKEPVSFVIGAAKGQMLEVTAEGSSIQVYLPSKKLYEIAEWEGEGGERTTTPTQIDRLVIESLPEAGSYLVVLRKLTENSRPASVTFKATSRR